MLSGGGSLGAVQVGMMRAIVERGHTPDLLVGTSVGALNAAYLAGDPSLAGVERLAHVWTRVRRTDVFPTPRASAISAVTGRRNYLLSNAPMRHLIERNLSYTNLEDAPVPVTVIAAEVATGFEVALSRGPAVDAVLASAALPGIFPTIQIGAHLLMDGGVVNNTAISIAIEAGADRVFVLPTGYACALSQPPQSVLGMVLHAFTFAIQRRLILEIAALQDRVELRVAPPICPLDISPMEFRRSDELMQRAYAATQRWLDQPPAPDQTRHLAFHRHSRTSHAREAPTGDD